MAAHQAPPSLGFSRQERWSGLPFPSPMQESESEVAQSCLTLRPHGPTMLFHPWDFPGKDTGGGCHALLQGNLPNPGIETCVSCITGRFFTSQSTRKAHGGTDLPSKALSQPTSGPPRLHSPGWRPCFYWFCVSTCMFQYEFSILSQDIGAVQLNQIHT